MPYLTESQRDIVLFIGAGFSRSAGLPVISEFGTEAKKDHAGLTKHAVAARKSGEFRHAAPMLVDAATTFELFQTLCKEATTLKESDINDLETIFCIAEILSEADQRYVYLNLQPYALDSLVSDIQLWIWKIYQQLPIIKEPQAVTVYDSFFDLLKLKEIAHRITVLSTNYDIVYEHFSFKHGMPCAYPISWDKQFKAGHGAEHFIYQNDHFHDKTIVCKLHGSVNFFEDRGKSDGILYVASDLSDGKPIGKSVLPEGMPAILAVDAIWNIRKKYGGVLTPSIIPPSYAKLGRRTWLRTIWNTALEALKNAKVIIFIGYGMPDSDGFMRSLLHGALALREHDSSLSVYVINDNKEVHKRYLKLFHSIKKRLKPQTFERAMETELPKILQRLS